MPADMGRIKWERRRERFAAHCPLGGVETVNDIVVPRAHGPGPCRLMKVKWKRPLGVFGAWLVCCDEFADQQAHLRGAADLCTETHVEARLIGRRFVEGAADSADLIEAEGGDNVEPLSIP